VGQRLVPFIAKAGAADLDTLKELIEDGRITPVIERTYALHEAAEAIRHLETGHARGKIVITVADS
jgi:NADPH:quinone reductase-like Zn-dependent oxidoreductase